MYAFENYTFIQFNYDKRQPFTVEEDEKREK